MWQDPIGAHDASAKAHAIARVRYMQMHARICKSLLGSDVHSFELGIPAGPIDVDVLQQVVMAMVHEQARACAGAYMYSEPGAYEGGVIIFARSRTDNLNKCRVSMISSIDMRRAGQRQWPQVKRVTFARAPILKRLAVGAGPAKSR
jgi:hypothetical protein